MDELANPYRPGAGLPPPALIGRDALLASFRTTTARALAGKPGKSVMPAGLRGVGKTVLLGQFAKIAEPQGYLVAHIEAPETGEFRRMLANRIRRALIDLSEGPTTAAVNAALRVFKSFSLTFPNDVSVSVDVEPLRGRADSRVFADDLSDLLIATAEAARDRKRGVLIIVDEVQHLSPEEFAAAITAIHATSQRDLPAVLVGAGLPQLPKLAGEAKSYAERLFTFPRIGSLTESDAFKAVAEPALEVGVTFSHGALAEIYRQTQGYPYFLQEWAYNVWNRAHASPIEASDVLAAEEHILRSLDEDFFSVRFDRLRPGEKRYLRAMASLGPEPQRSSTIAREYGAPVQSTARIRQELMEKGLLYSQEHGETAFTVPLFDQFLIRRIPTMDLAPPIDANGNGNGVSMLRKPAVT
jgi:hypothetical protein